MTQRFTPLTDGERRAAIVLVALGAQLSAEVMRHLPEAVVERLTYAISTLQRVTPTVRQSVSEQLVTEIEVQRQYNFGGIEYAREVLSKVIGRERAEELLSRITHRDAKRPFDFLADVEPMQLARFMQEEHPQTISLILAHLPPVLAARIFSCLPEENQAEVVNRIGMMDRSTEKSIMQELHSVNPELAEQVQAQMFVFEDLVLLDNRSLELVLREVDKKDLLLALRGAPDDVRDVIFHNMSRRAAQMMQEDLEVMGPVRLRTVEDAQKNIVKTVRKLEQEEQIVISRGSSEDVLV